MKKIKIIELLNKIANGEEVPEKIKFQIVLFAYFFDNADTEHFLNDEVEIIEDEKKIEKIGKGHYIDDEEVLEKIDEIIDYINNNHIPRID